MAKVQNNIVVKGLSGSLGDQLVIKRDKAGRTIVGVKPEFSENRQFTEAQQTQQEAFRQATAYAKSSKGENVYVEKAQGTPLSAYNVAVADWLHSPEILDIDMSNWTGQAGQLLRVKAQDDIKIQQVTVVITDETDAVLEQGSATQSDGLWWNYTTTAATSGNAKVIVSVQDMPGHIAQMTKTK